MGSGEIFISGSLEFFSARICSKFFKKIRLEIFREKSGREISGTGSTHPC